MLQFLREQCTLIILDNLETLLEEGEVVGRMRAGYEGYGILLRCISETGHQSCLVFTSREKPTSLVALEGNLSLIRLLRLARLEAKPCEQLLSERGVVGSDAEMAKLIDLYTGNPLALKIVAQTIVDLFDGEIAPFLDQGEIIFGNIRHLLTEQFARLSGLEQSLLLWLAILREPAKLNELSTALVTPIARGRVLEALQSLYRRSLIERGQTSGSFTLQSVVLEYLTTRLVEETSDELRRGTFSRLIEYGFAPAYASAYVRQTQERLLLRPLLNEMLSRYTDSASVESVLVAYLDHMRGLSDEAQGYCPANLLVLLRLLRGHLSALDLSRLSLRSIALHGVEMQDSLLMQALVRDCAFTETFDGIMSLSISDTGEYWVVATRNGEVRIWEKGGLNLYRLLQAASNSVAVAAISPDGKSLAGGCFDATIKYWDVTTGKLRWEWIPDASLIPPHRIVFSHDGNLLAIAHTDCNVRLWDPARGIVHEVLPHSHQVTVIALSPDGDLLVSGDVMGIIRVWTIHSGVKPTIITTVKAHERVTTGLAFSPEDDRFASSSWDGTVKLWRIAKGSLQLEETLSGHRGRVQRVAWSADGRIVASSGHDFVLLMWDVAQRRYRASLRGHSALVRGLAFTPDSHTLVSGSDDGIIGVWGVETGACIRIIHGYASMQYQINWSPDSQSLVCANSESMLTLYTLDETTPPRIMRGHKSAANYVVWSRDGRLIASDAMSENVLRLWDGNTGEALESVSYPDDPYNSFRGLAWSPDGQYLAIGMGSHGVCLFDVTTRTFRRFGERAPELVDLMAWSPDGERLVGSDGGDGSLYVWDFASGMLLYRLAGRYPQAAWSNDSQRLASSSGNDSNSEVFVWDSATGARLSPFISHPCSVVALGWTADDEYVITGGSDGALRWWDVETAECILQVEAHQGKVHSLKTSPDGAMVASSGGDGAIRIRDVHTGELLQTLRRDRPYERLNITGIRGLTDVQKATLLTLGAVEDRADEH